MKTARMTVMVVLMAILAVGCVSGRNPNGSFNGDSVNGRKWVEQNDPRTPMDKSRLAAIIADNGDAVAAIVMSSDASEEDKLAAIQEIEANRMTYGYGRYRRGAYRGNSRGRGGFGNESFKGAVVNKNTTTRRLTFEEFGIEIDVGAQDFEYVCLPPGKWKVGIFIFEDGAWNWQRSEEVEIDEIHANAYASNPAGGSSIKADWILNIRWDGL